MRPGLKMFVKKKKGPDVRKGGGRRKRAWWGRKGSERAEGGSKEGTPLPMCMGLLKDNLDNDDDDCYNNRL